MSFFLSKKCDYCERVAPELKACSNCHLPSCSFKQYQRKDWKKYNEEYKQWYETVQRRFDLLSDAEKPSDASVLHSEENTHEEEENPQNSSSLLQPNFVCNWCQKVCEIMAQMMTLWTGQGAERHAWSEARRAAQGRFPGLHVVESFDELPEEFVGMRPVTHYVLLARITRPYLWHFHHSVYIADSEKNETFVMFYFDYDNPPVPFFNWHQVTPGNYICIRNAFFHYFLDGTVGIKVNEASDVRIL